MQLLTRILAVPAFAIVHFMTNPALAGVRAEEADQSRARGAPLMAVVALNDQRVTIYGPDGKMLRAPVSTGQKGYETPAGIYSIIQKNREHYSNLYDDASMPFMQRITWSGIALHAGVLPGRPASHGCVRMPYDFAEELFELTKMGMRVVVVRDDIRPVDIAHPLLFRPTPVRVGSAPISIAQSSGSTDLVSTPPSANAPRTWRSIAAAKLAEAQAAATSADEARKAAVRTSAQAARFVKAIRIAEGAKLRAEQQVRDAVSLGETAESLETAQTAADAKAKAMERLANAQAQLDDTKAEGQPLIDAAAAAREAAKTAEAANIAAKGETQLAEAKMAPVSVFISRKNQRLYVRQAFQPLFESPVAIRDPDTPIGTTIYTALGYAADGSVRWSALSMYATSMNAEASPAPKVRGSGARTVEPALTDLFAAKAALDRIAIPQDAIERISEIVSPGSSLIISDEAASRETGKGTDFVVLMSGEPQGGIKIRRRNPYVGYGSERSFRQSPSYGKNPYSWW